MRACARGILILLSNNTSIIIFIPSIGIKNTTGRFFIPPVVLSNNIKRIKKTSPLLPFSLEMLMYRAFHDGSSCLNFSRVLRPLFIRVWTTWREKGTSFFDFLKNSPESVTDWPLLCYRLTIALLPTDHCFVTDWSLFSYRLKPIIGSVKASIW